VACNDISGDIVRRYCVYVVCSSIADDCIATRVAVGYDGQQALSQFDVALY